LRGRPDTGDLKEEVPMSEEKILVNVVEAGRMLGIGRSKTHELIAAGELAVVHIGRAARVPVRAVREYAEKLEKGVAAAAKPGVKTAEEMFKDAVQSLTGNYGKPIEQSGQPEQIKQDEAKRLQVARARLAQINKEIVEARKKREERESRRVEEPEKKQEQKKVVEKKEKESVLQRMIKSRQGSKEAMQRASG